MTTKVDNPRVSTQLHVGATTPPPVTMRFGRYQVVKRLATGGMAEVYLAVLGELSGFRTPVVVKRVLPHLAQNPQFIDMFLDEARIASLLDHPNVVRIYEVGRAGEEYFLAMELVQGKPLSSLLKWMVDVKTPLDPKLVALIVASAAAGLHHAHGLTDAVGNPLGLVHRDVSPQNILISFEGSVKVIDFGIARALGRLTDTSTGNLKGKLGYMSPEQARGEEIDLRTDVFALGVVLWEATAGKRLFTRDNDLATMRALVYEPVPAPSTIATVDPELEAIILRALAREPAARYQTARELASALEKYMFGKGGATASDLSALMKSAFAEDSVDWQRSVRAAMEYGTSPGMDVPAPIEVTAPGVGSRSLVRTADLPWFQQPRVLLAAGIVGVIALLLLGIVVLRRPSRPTVPAIIEVPGSSAAQPKVEKLPIVEPPPVIEPPAAEPGKAVRPRPRPAAKPVPRDSRRPNPF